MAFVIPSKIPRKASRGEQEMHLLLSRLPESCVVYYEPDVDGRRPDFVVIIPTLGLLVIEVKGWFAGNIESGDQNNVRYVRDGVLAVEKHPVRQARDYVDRLLNLIGKPPFAAHLTNHSGPNQGKPLFPVGHVALLSNMRDAQLEKSSADGTSLRQIFPPKSCASRDDLERWKRLNSDDLLASLVQYFDLFKMENQMGVEQIKALRGLIHPEIFFDTEQSPETVDETTERIRENAELLKVLDLKQEDFATSIGGGHRIIYGVAGSGKTLILLSRAKAILNQNPDARVLLVCYNRMLVTWIRAQLVDFKNVTVLTFHGWAIQNGVPIGGWDDDSILGDILLNVLNNRPGASALFDAVLVDEAQDFEPNWFRCLLAAMKDPENGDLVIVADGSQSIYRNSKVNWSQLGIRARGRTISTRFQLNRNYRNSSEIVNLAVNFLSAADAAEDESGDTILSLPTDSSLCLRETGAKPFLIQATDRRGELVCAFRLIQDLINGVWDGQSIKPLQPHEIAVLYPDSNDLEKEKLSRFTEGLTRDGIPTRWLSNSSRAESRDEVVRDGVKVQTIRSSKGLQYRAVILIWADKLPRPANFNDPVAQRQDRRHLYVGLTRAESFLAIIASGKSSFVDDIFESDAVQLVQPHQNKRDSKPSRRHSLVQTGSDR